MNWFSKSLGALAVMTATAAPLAAQDTSISGEISVLTWPNNDRTFEALMPAFNEAYPNIRVNIQAVVNNNNAYVNALQRALLTGGADVAMVEINQLALLRDKAQWADLSQAPFNAGDLMADFAPFTVANVTLPDGKIALLPKHTGPGGMFYRSDIFAEAGLPTDPAEVEALFSDWDAFIENGQKLVIPNQRWVLGSGDLIMWAMMAEKGVSFFDEEGNFQIDDPVFRQGLETVKRAADAGMISPFNQWSPEWQGAFGRGQLPVVFYGNWFGGLLKRSYAADQVGQWSVAAAPALDGSRAFNAGGDYIGVLDSSGNKDAAWAFVKWITTDEEALRSQFQNDDLYPAWTPAGEAEWMNTPDPFYNGQNVNTVFAPVQAAMTPAVLNPLDLTAQTALVTAINNVARGVMTVDEALAAAKAEVEAQM